MLRWPMIRTLLYKEVLRYRYNWGLLVMVFALLVLSGLLALSARLHRLPGQAGDGIRTCYVLHTGLAAQCACDAPGPAVCDAGAEEIKTVRLPASERVVLQANVASILFDLGVALVDIGGGTSAQRL